MDTSIAKQLQFLVNENTGAKLEKVIEQILESDIYSTSDLLSHPNMESVIFYIKKIHF